MKSSTSSFKSFILKNKAYTYIFSFSLPVVLGLIFFLFGFTKPELPNSNTAIPSTNKIPTNISSTLTYKVSDNELVDVEVQDVSISKMEQTKGLFTKNLNMSVVDKKGNVVALVLTDVRNGDFGPNLTKGIYYGKEHQNTDQNFSIDLGTVVFSNSSNLILEGSDGSSTLSRNGWIEIKKCKNGLLSGKFEFEIESNSTQIISEGAFENVSFVFSE